MSEVWNALVRDHGRKVVLDLHISDGEVDEITEEQAKYVMPLLKKQLAGPERVCVDYGCGSGRWTHHLQKIFLTAAGYDPSTEMIALTKGDAVGPWFFSDRDKLYGAYHGTVDVLFCWIVLGGLMEEEGDVYRAACDIANLLTPGGLLFLADHTEKPAHDTWWQFRPMSFYTDLFGTFGIKLRRIGQTRQLAHSVTIMAGRKPT